MKAKLTLVFVHLLSSVAISQQVTRPDSSTPFGAYDTVHLDQQPKMLRFVRPNYPSSAQKDSIEGNVWVDALINEKGKVEKVALYKGAREDLNQAALEAVKQWEFSPPMVNGKPAKVGMLQCLNFKLSSLKKTSQ